MRKGILITILIILPLIMGIHPGVANSETFVTGGGIITEGQGKDTNRIIFGVSVFTDETGIPSTGNLQINFLNTYYGLTDLDNFDKKIFKATEVTGGVIETRYWGGDSNKPYTFIRIEANGQLNGVDGWYTEVRFADNPVGEGGTILPDAVRMSIFDPSDVHVYDTAAGQAGQHDYPRDHSWRTFLDGGNVSVFYEEGDEACCLPDGSCTESTTDECSAQGGSAQGQDTICSEVSCPLPELEACCLPDGSCAESTIGECSAQGGSAQGQDTICSEVTCPPPALEACCLPGNSCADLTVNECSAQGGFSNGFGTECNQVTCGSIL